MPARNEAWVIGLSARVALAWCDALIVGLHACEDDTEEAIDALPPDDRARVRLMRFDEREWPEMAHRQALLEEARSAGATHVAIVDADEVLTGNLLRDVREHVERIPDGGVLWLPGYNLRQGVRRYHADGIWANRWFSTAFKDDPRLGWRGDRFHHREPFGMALRPYQPVGQGAGGVMHLWGASERRLRAKHAWYKMTETLRWPQKPRAEIERYYNQAMFPPAGASWRLAPGPDCWWAEWEGFRKGLRVDDAPWQEAECERLEFQHGGPRFAGLDLFGVV